MHSTVLGSRGAGSDRTGRKPKSPFLPELSHRGMEGNHSPLFWARGTLVSRLEAVGNINEKH